MIEITNDLEIYLEAHMIVLRVSHSYFKFMLDKI